MTSKTATIQYKPVTSLTGNNNTFAHYSHVAIIKYHMHYPIFMPCTSAAVISLKSYLCTVWTQVSCQAISPTNGLGTRLVQLRNRSNVERCGGKRGYCVCTFVSKWILVHSVCSDDSSQCWWHSEDISASNSGQVSSDCALLTMAVKVMTLKGLMWLGKYGCTHLSRQRTLLFVFLLFLCGYFSHIVCTSIASYWFLLVLQNLLGKCVHCFAQFTACFTCVSRQLANMLRLIDASGSSRHSSPPAHCLWLCVMDGSWLRYL